MSHSVQVPNAHVAQRLQSDIIAWFITVRPDGRPHSVPVWFLWDGEDILVFSKPNNQKLRNLQNNPNVVLSLDNTNGGGDIVTIDGKAELLDGQQTDLNTTLPAYSAKYGDRIKSFGWTPESMAAEYSQGIRVTLTRFY